MAGRRAPQAARDVVVVVASTNPVKIRAARGGFEAMFSDRRIDARGISIQAVTAAQPHGDDETRHGAVERVRAAQRLLPHADYWVGIEGGVTDHGSEMAAYAWVVVQSRDDRLAGVGRQGSARTGTFFLPPAVADLVRQGFELGEADDRVFGTTNSKQDAGAVGLLTGGVIDREALYRHAVCLALIPFKSGALYPAPQTG